MQSVNPFAEFDPLQMGLLSIKTKAQLTSIQEVKVPDTYLGLTQEFHPEGLYSSNIFGLQGSPQRMENVGYISLNAEIIIPDVFKQLKKARAFYIEIMRGSSYATFDTKLSDFIPTPIEEGGQTGYSFFLKHLPILKPQETGASTRSRLIRFLQKNKDSLTTRYLIVIPAGYRDMEQSDDGRMKSDDINNLYLAIMRSASFIQSTSTSFDNFRYQTQVAFNNIADYIDTILYGKSGLINAKYGKRAVRQGTRNVITAQIHNIKHLDDPANLNILDTTVGLVQILSLYPERILYELKTLLIDIMPDIGYPFAAINPNTHKSVQVKFDPEIYALFLTSSGLEKLIKIIRVPANRTRLLEANNYWLGALYKPPGTVELIHDVSLIENYNPLYLHPVTIGELLYLAIASVEDSLVGTSTRPPVLGKGGIEATPVRCVLVDTPEQRIMQHNLKHANSYPTMEYEYAQEKGTATSTTAHSKGKSTGEQNGGSGNGGYGAQKAYLVGQWLDSMTVSEIRDKSLSSDRDGDALSLLPLTSVESIANVETHLQKASTYFNPNGGFMYAMGDVAIANNIMLTLTS